jgi:hypothetical protein
MTGIEPAYQLGKSIPGSNRHSVRLLGGRHRLSRIPATSAVLVRLAHEARDAHESEAVSDFAAAKCRGPGLWR